MVIAPGIEVPDAEIEAICRRYRVKELSVFGSAARGEMRPDSDVDLLVDFQPDSRIGLLEFSAMVREFAELVGRRVDVAIKPALKRRIRGEVLEQAHLLYPA